MADAGRIVIPRCIGCGAMYEPERCEHGCREERLELVAAGELELVAAAERSALARIESVLPVVRALVEPLPPDTDCQRAHRTVAQAARQALHDLAPTPSSPDDCPGPQQISVWRCPRCGAVDAPQECLGICIWRRFEWVAVGDYDVARAEAIAVCELERRVLGLLRRVAFTTPRADAWERNWHALSHEAGILLERCAQIGEPAGVHV